MRILGIVSALEAEARVLVKKRPAAGKMLYLPEGVLLKLSGIGPEMAHLGAESLVEKGASALVSWGSAGGLLGGIPPGSLILPENVLTTDKETFLVDAAWHEQLHARLGGHMEVHTGPLIQSPVLLKTPADKTGLLEQSGAIAVDMESAAVARVAKMARIPFISIRAIVDTADMKIPDSALAGTNEFGGLCLRQLLKGLALHPEEIFPLIRLGLYFHAARTTLKTVLRLAGHRLLA